MAYAKAAGVYWSGSVDTFKAPDVETVQVRTRSGDGPRTDLIVRRSDDPDDVFVLVIGKIPNYRIVGWMRGHEAWRDEYIASHGSRAPAWFVPPDKLHEFPIRCPL